MALSNDRFLILLLAKLSALMEPTKLSLFFAEASDGSEGKPSTLAPEDAAEVVVVATAEIPSRNWDRVEQAPPSSVEERCGIYKELSLCHPGRSVLEVVSGGVVARPEKI